MLIFFNKKLISRINSAVITLLMLAFLMAPFFIAAQEGGVEEIKQLSSEIEAKQGDIEELRKKIEAYEQSLSVERSKSSSLKNQIYILETQIQKKQTEIKLNEAEINKTNLEINKTTEEIQKAEKDIADKQDKLANLLREIYREDEKSELEIVIMYDSISDYFNQLRMVEDIQTQVNDTLIDLKDLKITLGEKKDYLEKKKTEIKKKQEDLTSVQEGLIDQQNAKEYYLAQTKNSEAKYQQLVSKLKLEQDRINSEIVSLEKAIRAKLKGDQSLFDQLGDVTFVWPVPSRYVTTQFHDPDYPFRYVYEHPAIDIRAAQGTPLRAAASGYVAKVRDGGKYGYSYIMLVHANGFSTVYGHLSAMYVKVDQYVSQGEVIGATGGMPGTPGAGSMTTGPHLHFEVRKDGIPVNPEDYLP